MLLAFVAAACIPEPPPPPPPPPPSVVVYGDSLAAEAESELRARLTALLADHTIEIRSFAGTAQCDWHQWMQDDAAALSIVGVVISFTGNRTTTCMDGRDAVAAYTADANWAVDFWSGKGVPVMFVAGPTRVGTFPAADEIGNVYRSVGAARGVRVVDPAGLLVDETGAYAATMPCLVGECTDTIAVRSIDTVHWCPPGTAIPGGCSAYSSGAVRFAEAIVHGVASLLNVPHPPYRTMVTPTTPTTPTTTTTTTTTIPTTTTSIVSTTTTTNPLAPSE